MAETAEVIRRYKRRFNIKRDNDVNLIYMSNKNIQELKEEDFMPYRYLTILYLNNNKLFTINFFSACINLREIYLHHNRIRSIANCLYMLTSLKRLHLHNNQISDLESTINEFRKMVDLEDLNLFNNPIAQERGYKQYVIRRVPHLKLLDREEVTRKDKRIVPEIITVAFNRCSRGPPEVFYPHSPPITELPRKAVY
ncbi:DgyrCDS4627 [Dimorphilus gyrociliatus]|uniref:DgyrCDS4627 n=1 Tax=Dimorphilus gyrociliatus TaxID=2664684 RepID=A0A7I8VK68_9ANNE|nr:DgyrCDS4627 [Dimorphilus gyrociliatus]